MCAKNDVYIFGSQWDSDIDRFNTTVPLIIASTVTDLHSAVSCLHQI